MPSSLGQRLPYPHRQPHQSQVHPPLHRARNQINLVKRIKPLIDPAPSLASKTGCKAISPLNTAVVTPNRPTRPQRAHLSPSPLSHHTKTHQANTAATPNPFKAFATSPVTIPASIPDIASCKIGITIAL